MKTILLLLSITFSLSFQEHRVDFEGSYKADFCGSLEITFEKEGNYALKYSHFDLSGTYHSKGIFVKNHDTLILNELSHKIIADTFKRTKEGIVVSEFTMPIIFDTTNYCEELRQLLLIIENDTLLKTESIYCGEVYPRQQDFGTYFRKISALLEITEGQLND